MRTLLIILLVLVAIPAFGSELPEQDTKSQEPVVVAVIYDSEGEPVGFVLTPTDSIKDWILKIHYFLQDPMADIGDH